MTMRRDGGAVDESARAPVRSQLEFSLHTSVHSEGRTKKNTGHPLKKQLEILTEFLDLWSEYCKQITNM